MIDLFLNFMSERFLDGLNYAIQAGWIVLAILVIRILPIRLPKWSICLLWGLVALRLMLPFQIEFDWSLQPSAQPIPQNIAMERVPEIDSGVEVIDRVVNPVVTESFAPDPVASANPLQILIPLASVAWLLGIAVMLLYALISTLRLGHRVKASVREGKYYLCDDIQMPFVFGLVRPKIYLPSGISVNTLPHVLAHEERHIKRLDHLWKPLGFLILSIYWFHPLLWVGYILFCRDLEKACDEAVVGKLDQGDRKAYSEALLSVSMGKMRRLVCPLAFGEEGVKGRIQSVLHHKKPGFWIILVAILLVITLAVGFLTSPEKKIELSHKREYYASGDVDTISLLENAVRGNGRKLARYGYREKELLNDLPPISNLNGFLSDSYWNTETILGHYPTPNVRKVNDSHYYACYLTDMGASCFVFFDGVTGRPYGYPVYMVKTLSYVDFAEIREGTTLNDVATVDPVIGKYRDFFPKFDETRSAQDQNAALQEHYQTTGSYALTSMHLLTDGVLEIRYQYTEDGRIVVSNLHYAKDFRGINNAEEVFGAENLDEETWNLAFDYRILEKDYVTAKMAKTESQSDHSKTENLSAEGITLHLISCEERDGIPSILVEWENQSDDILEYGTMFSVYKDGKLHEPREEVAWLMPLFMVERGGSQTEIISFWAWDMTEPGKYRVDKTYNLASDRDTSYTASVSFAITEENGETFWQVEEKEVESQPLPPDGEPMHKEDLEDLLEYGVEDCKTILEELKDKKADCEAGGDTKGAKAAAAEIRETEEKLTLYQSLESRYAAGEDPDTLWQEYLKWLIGKTHPETETATVTDLLGYTAMGREMTSWHGVSTRMRAGLASLVYSGTAGEELFAIYLTTEEEATVREILERYQNSLVEGPAWDPLEVRHWYSWSEGGQKVRLNVGTMKIELIGQDGKYRHTDITMEDLETLNTLAENCYADPPEGMNPENDMTLGYTGAGREIGKYAVVGNRMRVSAFFDQFSIKSDRLDKFAVFLTPEEEQAVKAVVDRNWDLFTYEYRGNWEKMVSIQFTWSLDPDAENEYDRSATLLVWPEDRKVELIGMGGNCYHAELPKEDWQILIDVAKTCYEGTGASIVKES